MKWPFLAFWCGAWVLTTVAQAAPIVLTEAQARHLLVRTGFAPSQAEVNAITGGDTQAVVSAMLTMARNASPLHAPPQFTSMPPPIPAALLKSREEQQAMRRQQQREGLELKDWWMGEMIESRSPLAERMTLFWHNHFATSQQKVVRSQAMWSQHQLLRGNALGNFRTMLHAVAKDPAMLVYLDGANSRREAPNENFAREVMELFTLGEASKGGNYTETDIKEAARAFTGWSIDRDSFTYRYRPFFHDDGRKTVLGQSGNFDGDAVLDLLLEQDAAPRLIVSKLWKEFVSPVPDAVEVERIARQFRRDNFEVTPVLRELLLSDAFWAESNRGNLIKSPVDLVVGTVRQFGFHYTDALPFALKSAQLGQNLLVPPNVKGWPGYTDWINATLLMERKRFTEQLFRSADMRGDLRMADTAWGGNRQAITLLGRDGVMRVAEAMTRVQFDPDAFLMTYGCAADREPDDAGKDRLAQALLAVPPTRAVSPGTVGVAYLRTLTLDPAYQLK